MSVHHRGVGAIVLFGILGSALVSVTMLPALTISVLEWNDRRKAPAGQHLSARMP